MKYRDGKRSNAIVPAANYQFGGPFIAAGC